MRKLLAAAAMIALAVGCKAEPGSAGSSAGSSPGSSPGSATGSAGSAGAAAPDPWAATSAPRPPETPETRKARAEAAVGRVVSIEPEVARLRDLTFEHEVPAHFQPTDEFQAYVRREIAKDLPANRSRDISAALAHIGLFEKPVDLATIEEQALVTQAGAYYDPDSKQFFLVAVPDSELFLDTISAHELTHALQDQHFDLHKYMPPTGKLDEDASSARRFVVEGDATLVMMLYSVHKTIGDQVPASVIAGLRGQIEAFATQGIAEAKDQLKSQAALFTGLGNDIQKSIDAMDDIPPSVLVPMLDAYMKGALVALTAYQQGGWKAVDELYRDPPESTEQVLHPTTKLFPVREHPHKVVLARSSDLELSSNVLGELQWRIYFALWKVANPEAAAAGWGGDHYDVARRKDGRLIGRIATIWDDEAAATRFTDAYVTSVAARFPGADTSHPEAGIARAGGGKIFVRRTGTRVLIVDGADAASSLDALARAAKFD